MTRLKGDRDGKLLKRNLTPFRFLGQEADGGLFPPGGQVAVFWLGVPGCGSFCQPQFGTAPPCFFLLARQPGTQRGHQIVASVAVTC
jgi:hypothetical protein